MHRTTRFMTSLAACGALALGASACGGDDNGGSGESGSTGGQSAQNTQDLSGSIRIDGSSTVQPFAEAGAELFNGEAPNVKITVGGAGTGDGFERFCRGEIQIANASRPIEEDERAACKKGGVQLSEVQVANDGLAIATNKELKVDCFTTDQLKKLLAPKSKITNLSQLGGDMPDQKVSFFTPGEESGTFDFFTETILETDGEQRSSNVQTSADDNQLVTGVAGETGAIGYFGYSFAEQNADKLNIVGVDGGDGCVKPSKETIQDGSYKPLSRPIFMYPSDKAIKEPQVKGFMDYVLQNHEKVAEASQIVPMTSEQQQKAQQKLTQAES